MAWAIQALPHDVNFHLITSVSSEVMPEVEKLRQAGIKVTAYESDTNVFFENKYGANMDNRTQRVLAKSAPFTLNELNDEQARVFHLGTLLADDFAPEIVEYLATKGDVSIDVQGYLREVVGEEVRACEWTDKLRLLKHTAILKVNEWECQTLTNMTDPYEAAQQINDWGVREVIITLGGGGSVIYAEGQFYETLPIRLPNWLMPQAVATPTAQAICMPVPGDELYRKRSVCSRHVHAEAGTHRPLCPQHRRCAPNHQEQSITTITNDVPI